MNESEIEAKSKVESKTETDNRGNNICRSLWEPIIEEITYLNETDEEKRINQITHIKNDF
jgi:hypothetical protein